MKENKISNTEIELLKTAITRIVESELLEKYLSNQLPMADDLTDSNKVISGKTTILFVDMRNSTKLPERFNNEQLVKIYRSYIRTIVQAVRYSGGVVRDFMGDGVLAVFTDDDKNCSEDKAVHAARYITTTIDKFLNPVLDKNLKHRISCGIGVETGTITVSKVGMRGKEKDDESENEYGVAWIGNCTNLACKYSGVAENGSIFIGNATYSGLSNIEEKQIWKAISISKNGNLLKGYIAQSYYLELDEEVEAFCAKEKHDYPTNALEAIQAEYKKEVADLEKRAEKASLKEKELKDKELELTRKEQELNDQRKDQGLHELKLRLKEYDFYKDVLRSGHCKAAYVKAMGIDFWEDNLDALIVAGNNIAKTEQEVKQDISFAMVSIYEDLGLWDNAYEFLIYQTQGFPWINFSTGQRIVNKVGRSNRLKDALYHRLAKGDLSLENRNDFERLKDWIVFER